MFFQRLWHTHSEYLCLLYILTNCNYTQVADQPEGVEGDHVISDREGAMIKDDHPGCDEDDDQPTKSGNEEVIKVLHFLKLDKIIYFNKNYFRLRILIDLLFFKMIK